MVSTTQDSTARTGLAGGPNLASPSRGSPVGDRAAPAANEATASRSDNSTRSAKSRDETLVEFIDVEKMYGDFQAVKRLRLTIGRGEFLTFLGPSGSGKTTTLNMLAGFERPSQGVITLAGKSVDRLPPYNAISAWCSRTTRSSLT